MAEKKCINCVLEVEPREFVNRDTGVKVNYVSIVAVIDNVRVNLSVKQDCKALFNYLLTKLK